MAETLNARAAPDSAIDGATQQPLPSAEPAPAVSTERVVDTRFMPAIERVWDTGVLVFGAFTLLVHLFVFGLAGTFGALRWVVLALLPLALLAYRITRRSPGVAVPAALSDQPVTPLPRLDRALHLLVACAVVLAFPLTENYFVFWIAALLYFAVVY